MQVMKEQSMKEQKECHGFQNAHFPKDRFLRM